VGVICAYGGRVNVRVEGGRIVSSRDFRVETAAPLRVPVEIRFEGSDHLEAGFHAQVGLHGMFVPIPSPPPVGSLFQFELRMDRIKSVRGFAEVVWIRVRSEGPDRPRGMGAQYRLLVLDGEEVIKQRVLPLLQGA
jgi:hypothetical protein